MNENVETEVPQPTFPPPPLVKPRRRPLPDDRNAMIHRFTINRHTGEIIVGLYGDGKPAEISIRMEKESVMVSGLLNAFGKSVSLSLQYGIPLEELIPEFEGTYFEPAGYTKNQEIPAAKSVIDYTFRFLWRRFVSSSFVEERPSQGSSNN